MLLALERYQQYSLQIQPGRVVQVEPLVGSRSSPLDLGTHGGVQTQGTIAVMNCSLGIVHPQVTLRTITGGEGLRLKLKRENFFGDNHL